MKRFISFLIVSLLFPLGLIFAFSPSEITNHEASEDFIFTREFDKLVLDATLPSGNQGNSDVLKAFAIQSEGTARNINEVSKFILWQDKGKQGFQGMGIDGKIGELNLWNENYSWYLNNLEVLIPSEGLRIFVSVEVSGAPTNSRFLKMKIPALLDFNENGDYDLGDLGIYLQSKNNGPEGSNVINQYTQIFRTFVLDNLFPKSVITNPLDNSTVTATNYTIKGMARDQGNSTIQWVRLGIVEAGQTTWYDITQTSDDYLNWEYDWQNIAEGTYVLKVKSADWIGNQGESEEINVVVAQEVAEQAEEAEEAEEEASEENGTTEEQEQEEEPKTVIQLLQEQINALMLQIAELQSQFTETSTPIETISGIPSDFIFNNTLKLGMTEDEVKYLQIVLNSDIDTQLAVSGIGSSENETTYFGNLTKSAVIKFQDKYASEILTPWELTKGTGFVGETTRAKLNELLGK